VAATVAVKILDLPPAPAPDEASKTFERTAAEVREALERAHPGRTSVEYINLHLDPAEKESSAGQLLVTGRFPRPVVVIDGQARFAGHLQAATVVKAVGRLLALAAGKARG
jgi:hypothetical protein